MRSMMFPPRCFTCGRPIGHLWEKYIKEVKKGKSPGKVLDELGVKRYCCRRMFITFTEYIDDLMKYPRKRTQ
jgi:DNA-directed RNA polymerase subunit N